jgi:hypothetical protein
VTGRAIDAELPDATVRRQALGGDALCCGRLLRLLRCVPGLGTGCLKAAEPPADAFLPARTEQLSLFAALVWRQWLAAPAPGWQICVAVMTAGTPTSMTADTIAEMSFEQ